MNNDEQTLDSQESAPLSPIDARFDEIIQAMEKWVADNNLNGIEEIVRTALNAAVKNVVLQSFGLRKGWGNNWELDSHNKNSPAQQLVQEAVSTNGLAVLDSFSARELTSAAKKKIERSMQRAYEEYLSELAVEAAKKQAASDANAIIEAFVASKKLSKYLAMRKLLNT